MGSSLTCPSSNRQHSGSKFLLRIAADHPDKSSSGNTMDNSDTVDNTTNEAPSNISPIVTEFDDLEVTELGITLTSNKNICGSDICGSPDYQAINVSSCDQDGNSDQNEIKTVGENRPVSSSVTYICDHNEYHSGSDLSDDLDECSDQNEAEPACLHTSFSEQFCCAEVLESLDEVHVLPSVQDAIGQLSMTTHAESSAESTTAKVISALKGSRAQCGIPVTKLSVKWAPDVYDPPITSESHTVKGQRRRSKSIKEYNKHKNGKSKTIRSVGGEKKHASRSGGGEKKHAYRRSSNFVDTKTTWYGAAKGAKAYDASCLPEIPLLDYMSPELKCGASFCMEPLGRLHLSVAEAS